MTPSEIDLFDEELGFRTQYRVFCERLEKLSQYTQELRARAAKEDEQLPQLWGTDFLCYALFQVSALPISRVARQLASGNIADATFMLIGCLATFVVQMVFTVAGWRMTRARQMRAQYPFL